VFLTIPARMVLKVCRLLTYLIRPLSVETLSAHNKSQQV
jgi:hypothetical protein